MAAAGPDGGTARIAQPKRRQRATVVKNDSTISEDDLLNYCRENFTAYKRPKYIEFRDELPKSNVGKILRRELRSTA